MPDDRRSWMPDPTDSNSTGLNTSDAMQLAQASDTPQIGRVETVSGSVTVVHPDASSEALTTGAAIITGDRIETSGDGEIAVHFADDSVMALGPNSDLVIDEMVYDPSGPDGSMLVNVSEGLFTFISGAIAKVDPEAQTIQTPSLVIGIRGTSIAAQIAPEGSPSQVTLVNDPDGTVGEAVLQNAAGLQVVNQMGQTVHATSFFNPPPPPELLPPDRISELYGQAFAPLPPAFRPPVYVPPPPGQGHEGNNGGGNDNSSGTQGDAATGSGAEGGGEKDGDAGDKSAEQTEDQAGDSTTDAATTDAQTTEGTAASGEAVVNGDEQAAATDGRTTDNQAADGQAASDGDSPQDGLTTGAATGDTDSNAGNGSASGDADVTADSAGDASNGATSGSDTAGANDGTESAFAQAITQQDPFDGNQDAAAAAEQAFNQALANGASLDEATQAAMAAGEQIASTVDDTITVGEEALNDTGTIQAGEIGQTAETGLATETGEASRTDAAAQTSNQMTTTASYDSHSIFSAPVADSSFGTTQTSFGGAAVDPTADGGAFPGGADSGFEGGDGFEGGETNGAEGGTGDAGVVLPPPAPPPITTPQPETAAATNDQTTTATEPAAVSVVGTVPVASSAELFTLPGVKLGNALRADDAEDTVTQLSFTQSQSPANGSVTLTDHASQASVASVAGVDSRASIASQASIASHASQAAVASVALAATRASIASVAAISSQASVASQASIASHASVASQAEAGLQFQVPSHASVASRGSIASHASIASAASHASFASVGTLASAAAVASVGSVASQASYASVAAFEGIEYQASQASFAGETIYDYTSSAGATGTDSFVYSVTDTDGNSTTATINVTVNPSAIQAGTETHANTTTAGSQSIASVAASDFGQHLVVYNDVGSTNVLGQLFDSSGATIGSEFTVNTTTSGNQLIQVGTHAVAAYGPGDYVAVWQSDQGGTNDIWMQRFSALGDPIGAETQVNSTSSLSQVNASVASIDHSGRFVVTWSNETSVGSYDVFASIFNHNGSRIADLTVDSPGDSSAQTPQVAGLENQRFVVAWSDGNGTNNDVHAQIYDDNGSTVGSAIDVNTPDAGSEQSEVSVAALGDGGFVVAWTSDAGGDNDVYAQRFDASGTAQGSLVAVDTTASTDQQHASVTGLSDGGWLISWESYGAETASTYSIMAQRYNADGTLNGSTVTINNFDNGSAPASSDNQRGPALASMDNGGFAAAWHSSLADGGDSGILTNVFFMGASSPVNETGTAGNDAYIGSIVGDVIDSLGGDDKIFGRAGDDTLSGGDGDDQIMGEAGNDTIDGGAGNDLLYGGSGTDTITGGAGADRFFFDSQTDGTTVTDFTSGTDKLIVDAGVIGDRNIVFEQIGATYNGTNASDPNANVIVDGSGDVYHDSNGNAAGGYTLLGHVDNGGSPATLTDNDVEKV